MNTTIKIAAPTLNINAPTFPNKFDNGTAIAAPIAPPPTPDVPIEYASFITSVSSLFGSSSPLVI